MKKIIDINGRKLEFEATATTDHMIETVFNIRFLQALNKSPEEDQPELIKKLAFIMNKRAELGSWRKVEDLTQEDFWDWLDTIDSFALEEEKTAKEILNLYINNKGTKVFPKNQASPQAGS